MRKRNQIRIIGGGIAGLTAALALQSKSMDYQLFEKDSEITYSNVGFGISANIFPILEEWNILNETKLIGAEIKKFYFVNEKLEHINSFNIKQPALSVNRKLFYKIIEERLYINNIFLGLNKNIDDFSENEIVISAEGINSRSRQILYPNLGLRDSKQILWRGISKIELDEKFKNSYFDFVGNNLRFAIIDTGCNTYSWYAIKQKTSNEQPIPDKNALFKLFKNYHPIVNEVILYSENVYFSELKDIDPKRRNHLRWYKNNNILIGDAIHPTTPNMANGGCLAIEDAYLLSHLLNDDKLETPEVFKKFQILRTKKVNSVVNQSWRFGQLLHQQNNILNSVIKFGMYMTPDFLFNKIYSTVLVETKSIK